MKKIKLPIIPFVIFIIAISCDPPKSLYSANNADIVQLTAKVLNPKDTFALGDTIKFYFEVPDSISFNGILTKVGIANGDICFINQYVYKVDSSYYSSVSRAHSDKCLELGSIGYIDNHSGNLYFGNDNGIFKTFYYLVPKIKGPYYLEEGRNSFMICGNNLIRSSLHFDFGNVNRHFEYITENVKPEQKNNVMQFLSDKGQGKNYELYAFYVK